MIRSIPVILLLIPICTFFAGCEWLRILPQDTVSGTDVASAHPGGPSAEISISMFSDILKDEVEGVPCPPAWGTYREYWIGRMEWIRENQSKEYYERVWRDFPEARRKLNLPPITVLPYEQANS